MCEIMKQLDINKYSFGHLTQILSLHYLVEFRSLNLVTYNNEFLLGSEYVGSEIIT